jgi:hypothetical protein
MRPIGFVNWPPCKRCGKTLRYDYDGYCMDCADDLRMSELFDHGNQRDATRADEEAEQQNLTS